MMSLFPSKTSINSSPPILAMKPSEKLFCIISAVAAKAVSPDWWPKVSLRALKLSRSK